MMQLVSGALFSCMNSNDAKWLSMTCMSGGGLDEIILRNVTSLKSYGR